MAEWKKYAEEHPAEAGDYLVIFDPCGMDTVNAFVESYYKFGDRLYSDSEGPFKGNTAEEKLLDQIMNHQVIAMKEGFYHIEMDLDTGEESASEIVPMWWAELPEPPEGFKWDR